MAAFAAWSAVLGAEQERPHFEVPAKDSAKAEELANQLANLSRQSRSKRSKTAVRMRLCHGGAIKAGVSAVWDADFQQFPCVSWLEETRLLLSMDGGPAPCVGQAKTQDD